MVNGNTKVSGGRGTGEEKVRKVVVKSNVCFTQMKDETFFYVDRELPSSAPGINRIN